MVGLDRVRRDEEPPRLGANLTDAARRGSISELLPRLVGADG